MDSGSRFGDYVILKQLASGGMAQVYLARKTGQLGFTRPVAMKVILPQFSANKEFVKMFLDEARLAVCLNHNHIAQILDLGEVEGQYFIAMEFAHGMDLQQISKKTRKLGRLLPLPYAAKIISQVAEGLYYAHTKVDDRGQALNIVHRDVSPHNILLTFEGQAKLIDFGIAKATVTFKEEERGVLKGKFSYMSPEQIRGLPLDSRSDIFALGIVLWEVCTGASLYRESSELLTMEAILRKPVPKPRELRGDMPPDLEAIILKALAKRAVDRFQTAYEMHQALEGYLNRSGWNVGTPHLAEFMKKLFPDEHREILDILGRDREVAESAATRDTGYVPWEPYAGNEEEVKVTASPAAAPPPRSTLEVEAVAPPSRRTAARRSRFLAVWVTLVMVLLLGGLGALWYFHQSEKPPDGSGKGTPVASTLGKLHVESEPAGAEVFINGKSVGRAPLDVPDLPLNEDLTVRLELSGHEPFMAPVRLSAAHSQQDVKARLQRL
ncbi:MAG: protein kinase [Myxococcales bacterium]|nr:protein kinase [Myxococcales bacterium]